MKVELPPETVAQIERLNGLLKKTVKTKDIITEEETETTVPSDLVKAYFARWRRMTTRRWNIMPAGSMR